MYVQFGTYRHVSNEVGITFSRAAQLNDAHQTYGYIQTMTLDGFIQAADIPSLTAAIRNLNNAYTTQGFTSGVGLFNDDGTPTYHVIIPGQTLDGVRVIDGPSFTDWAGAEYTTYRKYRVTLQAEQRVASVPFLAWTESISFVGLGGPRLRVQEALTGKPQLQRLTQATACLASQVGMAVGQLAYPTPPRPLWPNLLQPEESGIDEKMPKRRGLAFVDYEVSWKYSFVSPVPLLGTATPNRWPL